MEMPGHSSLLTQILWDFQQKDLFCDVTLKSHDQMINAHRVILAANSGYFRDVLCQGKVDSGPVNCDNINSKCLIELLEFMYTGMLNVSGVNIEEIVKAAEFMRINQLIELCSQYIQECKKEEKFSETSEFSEALTEFFSREKIKPGASPQDRISRPVKVKYKLIDTANIEEKAASEDFEVTDSDGSDNESDGNIDGVEGNEANKELVNTIIIRDKNKIKLSDASTSTDLPTKGRRGPRGPQRGKRERCLHCSRSYLPKNMAKHLTKCLLNMGGEDMQYPADKPMGFTPYIVEGDKVSFKDLYGKKNKETKDDGTIIWRCEICDWTVAKSKRLYLNHKYRKHGIPVDSRLVYKCNHPGCTYETLIGKHLSTHKARHEGHMKKVVCDLCGIEVLALSLAQHKKIKHAPQLPMPCKLCDFVAEGEVSLRYHHRTSHENMIWKCPHCPYIGRTKRRIEEHLESRHDVAMPGSRKSHECLECHYQCRSTSRLRAHMRIHTGEKPYVCDICGKTFTVRHTLNKHKRVHTGERPYKCPHENCGYSASYREAMKQHIINRHTSQEDARTHMCHLCGYRAKIRGNLHHHLRRKHKLQLPLNQLTSATAQQDGAGDGVQGLGKEKDQQTVENHHMIGQKPDLQQQSIMLPDLMQTQHQPPHQGLPPSSESEAGGIMVASLQEQQQQQQQQQQEPSIAHDMHAHNMGVPFEMLTASQQAQAAAYFGGPVFYYRTVHH